MLSTETCIILIIIVIVLMYNTGGNNASENEQMYTGLNNFEDLNDMSSPLEYQNMNTKYHSSPLWNDVNGKIFTIVGGNSLNEFSAGKRFRVRSKDCNGIKTNMPFYYVETSTDAKEWLLHPMYSVAGNEVSFEGYNTFNLDTAGGNLSFIRYPNGRIWVENTSGNGDLYNIEITDLKIPFLVDDEPEEGANETTSALSGSNNK